MFKYLIEGGHPLRGSLRASGNKNAALPCLAATLLTAEPVILRNLPDIEDVQVMIEILQQLGSRAQKIGDHAWRLESGNPAPCAVPAELARQVRASILVAGPLRARCGTVTLPPPGGDVIGRRRLDTHFLALKELGARVEIDGQISLQANKLAGADLFLDEASVTATENAIMAAALAEGTTVIQNAASEPHVQDLCALLGAMGARITGIGSNILTIRGVEALGGADYTISTDFMEVGSLIGLAAVTGSALEIRDAAPRFLRMTRIAFGRLGIHWETDGETIRVPAGQDLRVVPDIGGSIPKIDDAPWPGFPPDLISIALVTATQAEGTVLIYEKMFESRMFFVDKLIGMGARIILCDPHRAVVSGRCRLKGAELVSPDVRAGMAMVLAALCAEGSSTIDNVYQVERGYENLAARLKALGAHIERVPE
jgi:UDP-N-acetylglucosamine 1-carboxyvinyltransferase